MEPQSLEDIEKRLYQKEKLPEWKPAEPNKETVGPTEPVNLEPEAQSSISSFGWRRIIVWFSVIVVIGISLAAFVFWRGFFAFTKSGVELLVEAPQEAIAGQEVTWLVKIENKNRTALEAGELLFEFPINSRDPVTDQVKAREVRQVGVLNPKQTIEESFSAVVLGPEDFKRTARARFLFMPSDSSLTFDQEQEHTLTISDFPVSLEVVAPQETLSGEEISISYRIKNESDKVFNNIRVRLQYPSGFRVVESEEPLADFNTIWPVGSLLAGQEKENQIKGVVSGVGGEGKVFKMLFEYRELNNWQVYKEDSFRSLLATAPLELVIKLLEPIGDDVSIGQELVYELGVKNNFDVALNNISLSAQLEGSMFNLSSLRANGNISSGGRLINWSVAQIPALQVLRPNEAVSTTVRIRVANSFPNRIVNPTLLVQSTAESPTQPTGLTAERVRSVASHEIKVNGDINLSALGHFSEPTNLTRNTGPYPPQVGKKTTFTIHWKLTSFANGFNDVTIKATLPSGISWEDEVYLRGSLGEVHYDSSRREVSWVINEIGPNRGLGSSPIEAIFKVAAEPSPFQEGQVMDILSETFLKATDSFTGNAIEISERKIDTSLGGGSNGRVRE